MQGMGKKSAIKRGSTSPSAPAASEEFEVTSSS